MKVQYKYIGSERKDELKEVANITLSKKELSKALKEIDKWGMFLSVAYLKVGNKNITVRRSGYSGIVWLENSKGEQISSAELYNSNNQQARSMYYEAKKYIK
jgi:hypothetical protein